MDGFNIRIKRDCFDSGLLLHNLPPLPEKPQSDDVIHTIRLGVLLDALQTFPQRRAFGFKATEVLFELM